MASVRVPSCRDGVCECAMAVFVPYPLHKFRRTSSFSYWWLWQISVLTSYHLLSANYVRVRRFSFPVLSLYLYNVFDSFFFWSNHNHISHSGVIIDPPCFVVFSNNVISPIFPCVITFYTEELSSPVVIWYIYLYTIILCILLVM